MGGYFDSIYHSNRKHIKQTEPNWALSMAAAVPSGVIKNI